MMFDYENQDQHDIGSVADAIRALHRLPELSEEEKLQRVITSEIRREEERWRAEERRAKRARQAAEAAAAANAKAATAMSERQRQLHLEQRARDRERRREQQMVDLSIQAAQSAGGPPASKPQLAMRFPRASSRLC